MNELETLKKKLIYRSNYRGTKEMDILLSSFVKAYIDKFDKNELKDLDNFLDYEDEFIYNLYQNDTTNSKLPNNSIIDIFKNFKI
jgi:antitoxin CptB|tara:strand:+ start:1161 stop:1415 length:255 start_codon:yes stop_codon:yes gene_type:complete